MNTVDLDDLALQEASRATRTRIDIDTSTLHATRLTGDEATLRRVIRNLLDNADRHAASRIKITTRNQQDHAIIAVHDDGPGIPTEDRDHAFHRFTRLDHARSHTDGGAGLGLAIVAAVVSAHHGHVTIEDSPLGGAAVTVRLPITPDKRQRTSTE